MKPLTVGNVQPKEVVFLYCAITVTNGIITGIHESMCPITNDTFAASPLYAGHDVIEVSKGVQISEGLPVASYDEKWRLKPLSQRVAEQLITIEPGYMLDGEEIREMTVSEKVAAGILTIDEGYVFDGDTIRPMTLNEKITAGIASEDDLKAAAAAQLQVELNTLYAWFDMYDKQVAQYQRCLRTGKQYDKDIAVLDAEAQQKQLRIRELRQLI